MLWTILYIIYFALVLALVFRVLLSGSHPTKTLTWILVILLFPIGGILLYLSLGINRRKYKFFKLRKNKALQQYFEQADPFYQNMEKEVQQHSFEIRENLKLSKLIIKSSKFLPYDGNRVQLLRDGTATFEAILAALNSAQRFIYLQYYIYEEGELADQLAKVFAQKIQEGVAIKLIYDGIGSRKLSKKHLRHLMQMGVQVFGFLPLRFGRTTTTLNYRNHRKIIIVDGTVGFTGGINISDKYLKGDPVLGTWHDMHLRLEGPALSSLLAVFAMDWYYASGQEVLLKTGNFKIPEFVGDTTVQIVSSGPDSDFSSIRQQYFSLINQAKQYVYIANSYIIPGVAILEALQTAALSGIDVRLLIPKNSDISIVKWSIRAYFEDLLMAGVKIYLYPDGFLHSKTIVTDDTISSVGSANLDIRSFEQNFEINAMIFDTTIAQELKAYFLEDCKKSMQLDLVEYQKRPIWDRLKEGVGRIFSPIL